MESASVASLPETDVTIDSIPDKGCRDNLRNGANSLHTDMADRPTTLNCILWLRKFRILRVYEMHILHPT